MFGHNTISEIKEHKKSLEVGYEKRLRLFKSYLDVYSRTHGITRKQALSVCLKITVQ